MPAKVTCIILAGGKGSRLFPLTEKRAKPAVRFGGGYRLIDIPISNALNCGIEDILVYTQYYPEALEEHIFKSFSTKRISPAHIKTMHPQENAGGQIDWFLGTADAVRKSVHDLQAIDTEYFLILSGDQLYTMDLSDMIASAEEKKADLVIATLLVGEEDAKRFGLMKINENKEIVDFFEKPQDKVTLERFELVDHKDHYLASMGIYLFKKETLLNLMSEKGDDFGKEIIPIQVGRGNTYAFVYQGYWEDIGTIPAFYRANLALLAQENCLDTHDTKHPIYAMEHQLPLPLIKSIVSNSLISPGVFLGAKEVIDSIIGLNTHVEEGTIIEQSVILGGDHYFPTKSSTTIGKNCHLRKVIIDEECHIGNNVRLINKDNLQHYDGKGIYIRDGIMVVSAGTILPDGFEL